jgi:hypothetical protein
MKVVFSRSGTGPYTIHQEGDRFLLVSHRGPQIQVAGNSEEDVIQKLKQRIGVVKIQDYQDNVLAYSAILAELKSQVKVP